MPRTQQTEENLRARAKKLRDAANIMARKRKAKERKIEARKHFIVGDFMVSLYGPKLEKLPPRYRARLNAWVKDEKAREYFGLPPKKGANA